MLTLENNNSSEGSSKELVAGVNTSGLSNANTADAKEKYDIGAGMTSPHLKFEDSQKGGDPLAGGEFGSNLIPQMELEQTPNYSIRSRKPFNRERME